MSNLPDNVTHAMIDGGRHGGPGCDSCESPLHDDNESRIIDVYEPIRSTFAKPGEFGWTSTGGQKPLLTTKRSVCDFCAEEFVTDSAIVLFRNGDFEEAVWYGIEAGFPEHAIIKQGELAKLKDAVASRDAANRAVRMRDDIIAGERAANLVYRTDNDSLRQRIAVLEDLLAQSRNRNAA